MKVVEPDQTLARIELSPEDVHSTAQADTTRFTATPISEAGTEMSDVDVSWSSSNPDVAEVSADGVARVVGEGQASITALAQDAEASAQLSANFRTEATVDPSGGAVESTDEKLHLDMPQGAVSADTNVSVTAVEDSMTKFAWASSSGRHYSLEPHGLQLDSAATGTFRYDGEAEGMSLLKFSGDTSRARLVTIDQQDLQNSKVTFDLEGFSFITNFFYRVAGGTPGWSVLDLRWGTPTLHWYLVPPDNPDQSFLSKTRIRLALEEWGVETVDLAFEEVSDRSKAQLIFTETDAIRWYDQGICKTGLMVSGSKAGAACFDGSAVWLERELESNDQVRILFDTQSTDEPRGLLRHEIGHALGLMHPWKKDESKRVVMGTWDNAKAATTLHEWDREALWHHYERNNYPSGSIRSPDDGATFSQGESITFDGTAGDDEDGDLSGNQMRWWRSSMEANYWEGTQIGSGETFTRSDLPAGEHKITLVTEDSEGAITTTSVAITVESTTTGSGSGSYDGFEDGTLTDIWTINRDDPYASGTVDQTRPLFGNYSYHVTVGSARNAHFAIHHDFSSAVQDTATFSGWIYLQGNGSGTTFHFTVRNPNTSSVAGLHAGPWGDIRYATDQVSGDQNKNVLVNGFQSGKWYRFEIFADPGTGTVDFRITDRNGNSWSDTGVSATVDFTRIKVGASDYNLNYEVWADSVSYEP